MKLYHLKHAVAAYKIVGLEDHKNGYQKVIILHDGTHRSRYTVSQYSAQAERVQVGCYLIFDGDGFRVQSAKGFESFYVQSDKPVEPAPPLRDTDGRPTVLDRLAELEQSIGVLHGADARLMRNCNRLEDRIAALEAGINSKSTEEARILKSAADSSLTNLIVIGSKPDGGFFFENSTPSRNVLLWLLGHMTYLAEQEQAAPPKHGEVRCVPCNEA